MITLTLPYPCSANRYWQTRVLKAKATGRYMAVTYPTNEAKAYKEEVRWRAVAAGVREPIIGRVLVTYSLFPNRPQDWARRAKKDPFGWADSVQCIDLGNAEKVMSDALNGTVIEDDRWIWKLIGDKNEPDEHGARLVVTVQSLQTETP